MSRRQRAPRTDDTRSTYDKILEQAVNVVNEDGFDLFNVQKVLDAAGVSRATLYHHFSNVDDLIEAALVATYTQEVEVTYTMISDIVSRCTDAAAFREEARKVIGARTGFAPSVRLRRAHTIALCASRPTLAAKIAELQDNLTDGLEATFREGQRRGLMRTDLDARGFAVMIQAIQLGRIIDDAGNKKIGDANWAETFFDLVDHGALLPGS